MTARPRTAPALQEAAALIQSDHYAFVVSEGSGRVASESLVAGIPCLVSDRGGLPAEVGAGGFILPLPDNLRRDSRVAHRSP
jgi:glycosyltransferase involved in cell wall biosynthesis